MNKTQWVSLVAFVLGTGAFRMYTHQIEKEVRGGALREVLVVTRDIEPGSILTDEDLSVLAVPSSYLDGRHILAEERPHLVGTSLGERLVAGDQLVWSDLAEGVRGERLAKLITPGMRAYSLPEDVNPLGRLLRSGDQVDVLLETNGEISVLFERVLVLAVGGRMESDEPGQDVGRRLARVTVSVTQEQASAILAAESRGNLRIVLRNSDDVQRLDRAAKPDVEVAQRTQVTSGTPTEIEHVR